MSTVNDVLHIRLEDWSLFIFILLLLIFAIPTVHEQIKKFFTTVGLVSTRVIKKSEYEKRVDKIENDISDLRNDMRELNEGVKKITEMLEGHIEQDRENNVAIIRNSLWGLYKESIAQGYITKEGLSTFIELGNVYEQCGGNDIYHEKLHPAIMELDVR